MDKTTNIKEKYDFLYPLIGTEDFNIKISQKRQFWDTRYPEEEEKQNVREWGNFICHEKEFELMPHQLFVRNFLSSQTPYNSLLLYHGLGTGKTCSAISVCELQREYQKQTNNMKKIWIIASPNVKENFKTQLFDHRKLKKINGIWNLKACTGNAYLKEINPMSIKDLSKEHVIREVNKIIRSSYLFIGYTEFSNLIERLFKLVKDEDKQIKLIEKKFSDSLIVIDEVHNIRHSADNPQKKVAINLLKVVQNTNNLKLLFLSATPMYNNREEIVWLLNIMNVNDKRPPVKMGDIFNKDGTVNVETLISKAIGYISYLRGQNPYTFPYRIWPKTFKKKYSLRTIEERATKTARGRFYPEKQINGIDILEPIQHLDLYIVQLDPYQAVGYNAVVDKIKQNLPTKQSVKAGLGYEAIGNAIQSLNMIYPYDLPIKDETKLYGKKGLQKIMKYNKKKQNFNYRSSPLKKYGRIFSQDQIYKYSAKIASFTQTIQKSKGIILIYSQYLDAGCIPIALALEEMGITRFGRSSLFAKPPSPPVSFDTLAPQQSGKTFVPAKYAMITGDINLSPNKNKIEMKAITDAENINGEIIKVVIITKAGAEGLDFKNIRQIHILEPWYNLNRTEQVIGRGVRNCSHKNLKYSQRNVELYMYGTMIDKKNKEEAADLYIYRKAEAKARGIGYISRILKKNAVDCILNSPYNNLSIDKEVLQHLSSKKTLIKFNIKNKPYSALCDYMEHCSYKCTPFKKITARDINDDTYNETFIVMNIDKIIRRISNLIKEQFVYSKEDLINHIRANKPYPLMQINSALSQLINDKNQYITDMFGRLGHLVNIGEYYMFQPLNIDDDHISHYERSRPLAYKREKIILKNLQERKVMPTIDIKNTLQRLYSCATSNEPCDDNWASSLYSTLGILKNHPFNIEENILLDFICEHLFDSLSFEHKLVILNDLWALEPLDRFDRRMKNVIRENFMIKTPKGDITPFVKYNISAKRIDKSFFILKKNAWSEITRDDLVKGGFITEIQRIYDIPHLNAIFGFMGFDKSKNIKFKIINRGQASGRIMKGFQCSTQQKTKTINLLNTLMKKSPIVPMRKIQFTTDIIQNEYEILVQRGFSRDKLCNIEEFLLRYFNRQDKEKTWFLSSFATQYNKIEK